MRKNIEILLVDDHNLIIEGCKNLLNQRSLDKSLNYKIKLANNCDLAWKLIKENKPDLVCLDIKFGKYKSQDFPTGKELGLRIRKDYPDTKIVILTNLSNSYQIRNILLDINPDGFVLKEETTAHDLIKCFEKALICPPYLGSKIGKIIQNEITSKLSVDEKDRIILYQLSIGTKTKDLPNYVHLSLRAIENRKKKLKINFGIHDEGNRELILKAKEHDLI